MESKNAWYTALIFLAAFLLNCFLGLNVNAAELERGDLRQAIETAAAEQKQAAEAMELETSKIETPILVAKGH